MDKIELIQQQRANQMGWGKRDGANLCSSSVIWLKRICEVKTQITESNESIIKKHKLVIEKGKMVWNLLTFPETVSID